LLGRLTPQNLGHLHSKLTQRRHQLTPIFADESELFYCEASFRNKQAKTWILGGDDTLWEDEIYYEDIIRQFIGYVGHWLPAISYREIRITLDQISVANSAQHGFGPHVFCQESDDDL
jgi:hypothetical protein